MGLHFPYSRRGAGAGCATCCGARPAIPTQARRYSFQETRVGWWVSRLALVGLGIALPLVIAELALCALGFEFDMAPDRVEFGWPDPEVLNDQYRREPELFWVQRDYPARLVALRSNRPEIVAIGDSCVEYSTHPALLAEQLDRAWPSTQIESASLGVAGWTSFQGRRQLERDVIPLAPDVVLIQFGWNDHWDAYGTADADVASIAFEEGGFLQELRLLDLLYQARVNLYRGRVARNLMSGSGMRPKRVAAEDFRANLSAMVRGAREADIVPVLVTAPSRHDRGDEPEYLRGSWLQDLNELIDVHERYVGIVRDVGAAEGVPVCDLAEEFAALHRTRSALDPPYFHDDGIHLLPDGSEIAARLLFDCFQRSDVLRARWQ
jgi:lysophospholipase L1-like esterase